MDAPLLQSMEGHLQTSMEVRVDNNNERKNTLKGMKKKEIGVVMFMNLASETSNQCETPQISNAPTSHEFTNL